MDGEDEASERQVYALDSIRLMELVHFSLVFLFLS
jgi:hypothetical protein